MAFWLVKSEPGSWSWHDQEAAGVTCWDGVRNHQASNNLKAMAVGDQALFYHSGNEKAVVGLVEVVRTWYPDPRDSSGRFGMVDVKTLAALPQPISLAAIKADSRLDHLGLIRQSRLSVMPVDEDAFRILCALGGLAA